MLVNLRVCFHPRDQTSWFCRKWSSTTSQVIDMQGLDELDLKALGTGGAQEREVLAGR
jgi:hypothetical protein